MPHIFQINASNGGVPKHPLPSADVTAFGLTVDSQNDAEHHGGPLRALCLYSLEHILALQAEGHPIYPGAAGENVTVSGLDWAQVVPGARLRLGEVVVEITEYTTPCSTIRAAFRDGMFARISQRKHPGWSRVYARVKTSGTIRVADEVVLV